MAAPRAWVLDYPAAVDAGPDVVGGKGWHLARLQRLGLRVPRGGVLVADAYRAFRSRGGLPDAVVAAIGEFLRSRGLDRVLLAVRSSATAEDRPTTSFAGVHESVLDVRGEHAVLDAIRACYASLESPRARAYRARMGLEMEAVACAVVLCEMVSRVRAAGVVFTADPRTGRRDRIVVSAARGRGTAVVGGNVSPQEAALDSGLADLAVTHSSGPPAMSDRELVRVARLAMRIEWALSEGEQPQDIEFAFDGAELWVLQARPITRLPRPAVPLQAGQPTLWSNGNLKDAMPGVLSTASWSFIGPYLNFILYAPFARLGYRVPPGVEAVRRFEGRAYLDLSLLQAVYFDAFGSAAAETNHGLGGPTAELDLPVATPALRRRWRRTTVRLLWVLLREAKPYREAIAQARAAARGYTAAARAMASAAPSPAEVERLGIEIARRQLEFGAAFQLGNMAAGVWSQVLTLTIERVLPGQGERLATALMAGSGQVVTAEHAYRLVEVATARDRAAALSAFLDEYGHRAVYEAELANPRWREDPAFLVAQLDALAASPTSPRDSAPRRRLDAERELSALPAPMRWVVRWIADRAREAAALREAGKSALIALSEPVRYLLLALGRQMTARGLLDAVDDVFALSRADIESYVRGEWDGGGARELVAQRRALRERRMASEGPPDLIVGADAVSPRPRTLAPAGGRSTEASVLGRLAPSASRGRSLEGVLKLSGIAAAAGTATGTARLIRHPSEGGRLQIGDILVAPSTDPGWTPLFLRAQALVTEVGGYLSHGAIVAREFGIPAVVNVPGAMALLSDGDQITVDGDTGQVTGLGRAR